MRENEGTKGFDCCGRNGVELFALVIGLRETFLSPNFLSGKSGGNHITCMGAVIARGTQTGAIWVALLFFGLLNERCVRARLWECEHFEAGDAGRAMRFPAAPVGTAAARCVVYVLWQGIAPMCGRIPLG